MRSATPKLIAISFILATLQLTGCQYRSKSDTSYLVAPNLFPAFIDTGTELITKDNVNLIVKTAGK
jgi:hypothetical protein